MSLCGTARALPCVIFVLRVSPGVVVLAFLGSTALVALGLYLYERQGQTQAALACVGTGIAALYASLTAALVLFHFGGLVSDAVIRVHQYHPGLYDLPWTVPFLWIAWLATEVRFPEPLSDQTPTSMNAPDFSLKRSWITSDIHGSDA